MVESGGSRFVAVIRALHWRTGGTGGHRQSEHARARRLRRLPAPDQTRPAGGPLPRLPTGHQRYPRQPDLQNRHRRRPTPLRHLGLTEPLAATSFAASPKHEGGEPPMPIETIDALLAGMALIPGPGVVDCPGSVSTPATSGSDGICIDAASRQSSVRYRVFVRLLALALIATGLMVALPSPASAASVPCWQRVIADWSKHGSLTGSYSASCLRQAMNNEPTDLKIYSNLDDTLKHALTVELRTARRLAGCPGPRRKPGRDGRLIVVTTAALLRRREPRPDHGRRHRRRRTRQTTRRRARATFAPPGRTPSRISPPVEAEGQDGRTRPESRLPRLRASWSPTETGSWSVASSARCTERGLTSRTPSRSRPES